MGRVSGRHIVVAFDFGFRRIGIATANQETRTASPLTTLRSDRVVGVPEGDGLRRAVARRAREFAAALAKRYELPVATVDETLTSVAASTELAEKRRSGYLRRRTGKGSIDRLAACLIAEQWLNQQ